MSSWNQQPARRTYQPDHPSPLSGSESASHEGTDNEGYQADSPESQLTPVNRRGNGPNDRVVNTGSRLQAVTDNRGGENRYSQLSPVDQRRRVGLAAMQPPGADETTPTRPPRTDTAGTRQRQAGQEMQMQRTELSNAQSTQQRSQLTAIDEIRLAVQRLENSSSVKDAEIETLKQDVKRLQVEVASLKGAHQNTIRNPSAEDIKKRAVSRMVKSAVETLYGQTKMTTSFVEGEQTDEMRWNYLQTSTSAFNHQQTRRVIAMIKDQRESIPLSRDNPREDIPLYDDAKDWFHEALYERFRQNQSAYKKDVVSRWGETPGPRDQLQAEIAQQQRLLTTAAPEARGEIIKQIAQLTDTMKKNDHALEILQSNDKPNVRSKLNAAVTRMTARRVQTKYHEDKYEGLECVYWIPAPYCDQSSGKWYEADWDGVYSTEYLTMFNEVWNLKLTKKAGSKRQTIIAPGPTVDDLPPDEIRRKVTLYLPSSTSFLPQTPQRWMFTQSWLEDPENAEIVESRIVPVDEPTSFDDVERLEWFQNHPWKIMKAKRDNKKRLRSESTQPATTDTDTNPAKSASATTRALNKGRTAPPAEKTAKRAKTSHQGLSLPGDQDFPEDLEDDEDQEESQVSQGTSRSTTGRQQAGRGTTSGPSMPEIDDMMGAQGDQRRGGLMGSMGPIGGMGGFQDQGRGMGQGWGPQDRGGYPGWAPNWTPMPGPYQNQPYQQMGNVFSAGPDGFDTPQVSRHPGQNNLPRYNQQPGSMQQGYGGYGGNGYQGDGMNAGMNSGNGGNGGGSSGGLMTTLYDENARNNGSPRQRNQRNPVQ